MKKILINSIERKVSYWDQLVDSEAAMFHVLGELFRDGIIATIGYSNFSETPCVKSKANTEGTTYERWVRFKIPEWNIQRVSELTFQMKLTQTRWQTQDVSIHSWPLGHSDRVLEAFYRRGDDGVWTIAAVPHFLGAK